MAIRTNPSYSTAHENLGDIYAKLASAAYAKALQLDSTNTAISPKLALIRELFAPNAKPSASAPQATSKSNSSAPAVLTTSPVKAVTPSAPPPAPTAVVAVPASPTSASSSGSSASAARDVEQAVENWAKAWSERDMKAYLGSYAKDFSPSGKLSRGDWEEERKSRIMGKAKIRVKLSNITVTVTGNTASAKFKQEYKADALTANSRKTLDLVRSGDRWLITKEFSG
jgi:ketosteroid isomerase-like protein